MEWKSTYAKKIADLQKADQDLQEAPLPAMYSPDEISRRQYANKREQALGSLLQLSGDKAMSGVGTPMLSRALAEQARKVTEHGEFDSLTGQQTLFPNYVRTKKEDRIAKNLATMQAAEAASEAKFDLEKSRAEDRRSLARAVAGANPGVFQAGTDLTPDGRPIVFHGRSGKFYVEGPNGKVEYTGPRMSRQDFGKETTMLDTHTRTGQRIADTLNRVESNKSAFGEGVGGAAVSLLPAPLRGIGTNAIFSNEEQVLRANVYEEAYQVAKELAGTAQSLNETVRLEPFTPQPGDPYEVVMNKLQAAQVKHEELTKKLNAKRAAAGVSHKPGVETAKPPATVQSSGQGGQNLGSEINYDASGKRVKQP